jgi:K+-sensing histidine kinase KdpD
MAIGYHKKMLLQNASDWSRKNNVAIRFSGAVVVTLLAAFIRMQLHPLIQPNLPFQFFYISTVIATFYWGWLPGVTSTLMGLLLAFYYFIRPYDSFEMPSDLDLLLTLIHLLSSLFLIGFVEFLQRSIYASELLLKASQSNYRMYVRSENDRIFLKKQLRNYKNFLSQALTEKDQLLFLATKTTVSLFFENSKEVIPSSLKPQAHEDLYSLFKSQYQGQVMRSVDLCMSQNTEVEFDFQWAFESQNSSLLHAKIKPIQTEELTGFLFFLASS